MNTTTTTKATYTAQSSWQTATQAVYQQTAVGSVSELKANETRVVLTPSMTTELTKNGHTVYVQSGIGSRAGYGDDQYTQAGAHVCKTAEEVYKKCSIIVKVNAPEPEEYSMIQAQQVIFCFTSTNTQQQQSQQQQQQQSHQQQQQAQQQQQQQQQFIKAMSDRHATVISYNSLTRASASPAATAQTTPSCSGYPVHTAVSEVAGYLGVQQAMALSQQTTGCTFGSTASTPGSTVLVLGATPCGVRAATVAAATGARVTLMDTDTEALQQISQSYPSITTIKYTQENLETALPKVNTLLGCIIPTTGAAPQLVTEQQIKMMQKGSVAIDLAAQYGGNFATTSKYSSSYSSNYSSSSNNSSSNSSNISSSSSTNTAETATSSLDGICLYTPSNITCLAPKTASCAISESALSYLLQVANKGWKKAVIECVGLQNGIAIAEGSVTNSALATATHTQYTPVETVLEPEINQIANTQQTNVTNLKQQLTTFRIQQSPFTIEA